MKKIISVFIAFILVIMPCSVAFGATYKIDKKLYAGAYMLVSLDDNTYPVVCEKNADKKMYPASLTKIVTTILTIKNVKNLDAKTKVSQTAYDALAGTGAQTAMLKVGDEISIKQLLYLTMVYSACDACNVLAEYVGGSISNFVKMMNDWTKSIGCKNTNFVNATGLHNENHFSTASDLRLITLEAMKSDVFMTMATTTEYKYGENTFPTTNFMTNPAYLSYYYEYAKGLKTGSTDEAGYCLISTASKDGYNYMAIVLDCPVTDYNSDGIVEKMSFIDSRTLYDWAFNSLKYKTIIKKNEVVSEIPVKDGRDADSVQLVVSKDISTLVPASLDPSTVVIKATGDTPKETSAPVTQGDVLGKANIIYGDEVIATTDLVAAKTIQVSRMLTFINAVKSFFKSTIVRVALVIIVLLALGYIYWIFANDKKKKAKKKQLSEENENIE